MSKLKQLPALFILAITDAYLISHPNLLGKMGVLIFKYGMIKNFPNALITVMVTLGLSYGIAHVLELNFDKKWAKIALSAFTALSLIILIQVIFKFSGGSYARTGKSFVWGMMLLPTLMLYIFGSVWFTKPKVIVS
jgi:hypothetical protein